VYYDKSYFENRKKRIGGNCALILTRSWHHINDLLTCLLTYCRATRCACAVDGVSTESLHSNRASAQNTSIHVLADTAVGRVVRLRLCADSLPQDGLSRSSSRHASDTVNTRTNDRASG